MFCTGGRYISAIGAILCSWRRHENIHILLQSWISDGRLKDGGGYDDGIAIEYFSSEGSPLGAYQIPQASRQIDLVELLRNPLIPTKTCLDQFSHSLIFFFPPHQPGRECSFKSLFAHAPHQCLWQSWLGRYLLHLRNAKH